ELPGSLECGSLDGELGARGRHRGLTVEMAAAEIAERRGIEDRAIAGQRFARWRRREARRFDAAVLLLDRADGEDGHAVLLADARRRAERPRGPGLVFPVEIDA